MGVIFDENNKNITWSSLPIGGATLRNFRFIITDLSVPTGVSEAFYVAGSSELSGLTFNSGASGLFDAGKFSFIVFFSVAGGAWYTTNDVLVNGYNEIVITYNGTSTANDPIFYHNGVAVPITERATPNGTITTNVNVDSIIGRISTKSPNGNVLMAQYITGRIVSAVEVLEAYNSRKAIPTYNGLVFSPQLNGAAGLQTFGGATLAAGNTIADSISGASGVPSGSPVGVADTILTYGG